MKCQEVIQGLLSPAVAFGAGLIALQQYRRSVAWKRAELAASYLKELLTNQELVFACRALDWNYVQLVVPDALQPLMHGDKLLKHEHKVMAQAMETPISATKIEADPRLQVYRTAFDTLLSWLSIVDNALERGLFAASDVPELKYWVEKAAGEKALADFIKVFEYDSRLARLVERFSTIAD